MENVLLHGGYKVSEKSHDPLEYIRGLQQLLISDKKQIAFLFGAGTSLSKKNDKSLTVPSMSEMTEKIVSILNKTDKYKDAIEEMKFEIGEEYFNIETFLSNIEEKKQVIGGGVLNSLNYNEFDLLINVTKDLIRKIVSIHTEILKDNNIDNLIHVDFAEWIGRAERKYPIQIFTTNYDYLFELGLEEKTIPYYDGFTGSYKPFFNSESIEDLCFLPEQTKLWKLHGSLGWYIDDSESGSTNKKVLRGNPIEKDIIIYPSLLKYNNSKKQPYISLMDRLTNYLKQDDAILIVCGYSFGDQHINERILTALKSNASSHVYILCHGNLSKGSNIEIISKECRRISSFGKKDAIIGCQYGKWKLKREPDKDDTINIQIYFDEDAPENDDDPIKKEMKGEEVWTGEGELKLTDFANFVNFLKTMMIQHDVKGEKQNAKY